MTIRRRGRAMRRGVAMLVILGAVSCAQAGPDLVLLDARVFTADPSRPWAEAVAIRGDRIVAVGATDEVRALARSGTVVRDLGGRTVLPGLNDAHVRDPGLDARGVAGFARDAMGAGVTSMQWFVDGRTVREVGEVLVVSGTPMRFRVLRMPRPGPDGETIDSRPHLPPQPGPRIDIRGMGFRLGDADVARLTQAVQWAYGTEDLLAIEPLSGAVLEAYVSAVERTGLAEVWARKRPRIEQAPTSAAALGSRIQSQGMVVVQLPDGTLPLRTLVEENVHLALATGTGGAPWDAIGWATSPDRGAEALTVAQAVLAFTRDAAYAELADRDKGHLTVGALADLTVTSTDPFTAPPESLRAIRSVLTLIGGRVVHDVP